MREILFRGKSTDNGEWVEGTYFPPANTLISYKLELIDGVVTFMDFCVIPETVGQFTGLTDKNGTKIFDGDILEFSDRLVTVFWHKNIGCWDCDFLKFTNKENGKEDMSPYCWKYSAKVIGNIYDNPELLDKVNE